VGFPSLRHNIFVTNGARLSVSDIQTDTGDSYFIYVAENSGADVSGVKSPLFVPSLLSVQPPSLSEETMTTFAFTGKSFYPCRLLMRFYRDEPSNSIPEIFTLNIPDESTATVTLANSLFEVSGKYYAYFLYGPGQNLQTPPIQMLTGSPSSSSGNDSTILTGLIIGVVIGVIAIIGLVLVVVIVLVWRYRIRKRWSTESQAELSGMMPGESSKVCINVYMNNNNY
jgi:hypothetical protein